MQNQKRFKKLSIPGFPRLSDGNGSKGRGRASKHKTLKPRLSQFERLESRRMLAAAVWNNLGHPFNVNGDTAGIVSPVDALLVVNELNTRKYSDPDTGRLPKQVSDDASNFFFDVSCDNFVSPLDALQVINFLNKGEDATGTNGTGVYPNAACSPQLEEGSEFTSSYSHELTLPDDSSAVKVHFQAPQFDTSSRQSIRDAFEIELTDSAGNQVSFPYLPGRDAVYNWSENLSPVFAVGAMTTTSEDPGTDSTVTINLSGMEAGAKVKVNARLVNNDADNNTSVVIRGFEVLDTNIPGPTGAPGVNARAAGVSVPVQLERLTDVSGSFSASYGRTSLAGDDNQLYTSLMVTNRSALAVTGQLIVAVENLSELEASAMHPDGILADGRPFWDLTPEMDGKPLGPGESVRSRQIAFKNDSGSRFTYELTTYGALNAAPTTFLSTPLTSIDAERTYRYASSAADPDGQALTYSLVRGPADASMDPATGLVVWETTSQDIGSHEMTIRATDPYGLFVEQSFSVEVLSTLQNRPPIFISDPVTDAIASSGFEITTVGVGASPAGVAVIDGLRGPRLVTANADDQTIGVYAGENNDRFDDVVEYETGHPRANQQWLDVGISLDLGFPKFVSSRDTRDIDNLVQGDFNQDGALDFVVAYTFDQSNDDSPGTSRVVVLLGDGNGEFGEANEIFSREIRDDRTLVRSLSAFDLNDDGNLDIVFNDRFGEGLLVSILGNGDGTFATPQETVFESAISDFQVADINGDGFLDLFGRTVASNAFSTSLFWSQGNGDGTFASPNEFRETRNSSGDGTRSPYELADLDGDGDLDFAISGDNQLLQVFHNDGNGNFTLENEFDPPSAQAYYNPDWLLVADFTGDGHKDILFFHVWLRQMDLMVGDESGINFTYREGTEIRTRAENWATDFQPIDVDGDGDLDLVHGTELGRAGVSVALNNGSGLFDYREYPIPDLSPSSQRNNVDATVRGAIFGDYNSDGVMDLAYYTGDNDLRGQTDANGVGVLFGTRPGEFGRTRTAPWDTATWVDVAYPGDFNGDGIPDLLDTASDVTALGNGDGTFGDRIPASGVRRPSWTAVVADFNQDGLDDVVSGLSGGLYVGLSNGDGTFEVNQNISGGGFYGYTTIDVEDFNQDGYPDFITKVEVGEYFEVYLNDPANPGTFEMSYTYALADGSQGVNVSFWLEAWDVGDFTGDGIPDLLTAERVAGSGSPVMVVVFAGDGTGDFARYSEVAGFDEEKQAAVLGSRVEPGNFSTGDVDKDGDLDLLATSTLGVRVFLNDGQGNYSYSGNLLQNLRWNQRGRDSWLVDFDQDGHLDFVTAAAADIVGAFHFWRGDGKGNFAVEQSINMYGEIVGIREPFVDWDGDGHLDLVYNTNIDAATEDVGFYMGRRDDLVDLLAVDLNDDGNEEVIAVQKQMERLQIFVGDNLGQFSRRNDLQGGLAPQAVSAADLNGDGQMEILAVNRVGRSVSVYTGDLEAGYDHSEYRLADELNLATSPVDIETADINADGLTDVVVLDAGRGALWVFTGNGSPTLGSATAISLGDTPKQFTLADANGDGKEDAVISLPLSNRLLILPGDGQGGFDSPVYVDVSDSPCGIAVLDLNDDGHADLAATLSGTGVVSVHFGLGNNQYARAQQIEVGSEPEQITVTDADRDGRLDLVVANSGDDTVSVIYNRFDPNEVYRYDADAIDPDNDQLVYSITEGPGGLIINSDNGQLLWAASPDQVGSHDVTLAADDGRGGIAMQSFKIEVTPARENASPVIASRPIQEIGANESFTYTVQALDRDDHPVRFRLLEGPQRATIDAATGKVAWDGRGSALRIGEEQVFGNVEVPTTEALQSPNLTVEGWFNAKELTRSNGASVFFRQQNQYGHAYHLRSLGNNRLQLFMNFDGASINFVIPFDTKVDRWNHVALVLDSDNLVASIYVDGHLLGQTDLPQAVEFENAGEIQVGERSSSPTLGSIDDFRIWNVALSQAELQAGFETANLDDPRIVLDLRFEEPEYDQISAKDYSGNGNHGYRISNGGGPQSARGLADIASHVFTIVAEDGRGGTDSQTFTLDVVPELRGSIVGHLFDDLNSNGIQDDGTVDGVPAEPNLEGWHLWIDTNNNAFPDPNEVQAGTDAEGNYSFEGLLPGEYPVSVSPVAGYQTPTEFVAIVQPEIVRELDANAVSNYDMAVDQLDPGQVRGQLQTEDGQAIAYWKAYVDLNGDGQRGEDEPMAMSDRDGNYAIAGLAAGTYTIRTDLPAGWMDSAGRDGKTVTIAANEILGGNDFVLEPTNTSVTGGVHFVTMPKVEVEARQTFTYASIAMGIGDDPIAYDLSLAPEGMTIDPATGLVAWRPTIDQVGEHLVILRANSSDGSIALHDFNLNVTAPNTAPVFSHFNASDPGAARPLPDAYVGMTYAVSLAAQDAEHDAVSYSLLASPDGVTLDADSGELRWMPEAADVGNQDFTIRMSDAAGAISTYQFSVEVLDQQPSTTPFEIGAARSQIGLGQDYFTQLRGTDAIGRPLTWALVSGPTGLTIEGNGTVRWTPSNAQLGEQSIELEVTNPDGATEQHSFTVEVVGHAVNSAPVIVSEPRLSATVDKVFEYGIDAEDEDLDVLAYALLEGPVGMSVNPSLGSLQWSPTSDQRGEHSVTVRVTDPNGQTDEQTFEVAVSTFGGPPKLTSIAPTEAAVGVGYLYSVGASDLEGDPLTYRLLALPQGMAINETTGEISWTPTVGQIGSQDVVVEVSDGTGGAATQAFSVLVRDGEPNQPPEFTSTAPRFGAVGQQYSYLAQATDPESSTITYSLGQAPAGLVIDSSVGQVTWTPASDQAGQFVVTIIATDEGGATAVESYELDVLAQNTAPVIVSEAPSQSTAGAEFRYDVLARDVDLDPLLFELIEGPSGVQLDAFGVLTWQSELDDVGSYNFSVSVADPRGGEAIQSFTLELVADTEPPRVSLIENLGDKSRNILPWMGPFTVFAKAIDNVEVASLTLSANGQDIPLDAAGTAKFAFEDWFFTTITATATAVDTSGNVTTKTISFNYDVPEGWSTNPGPEVPTAIITSPADNGTAFGMVSISGTADHADFGAYTLSYRRADETSFTEFVRSTTPVVDGELGVWDTSLLLNDEYVIRLQVATTEGTANVVEHNVGLAGELKLGNFQLSFTDMVIPVAGIPIEITRVYDTLQADREGDFGYGWRLEYRNTDLRVGLPKSGLEDIGIYSALRPGVKVYLNVPGEGRQGFTFDPDIRVLPGWGGNNLVLARPRFAPDPGVTSTLGTGTSSYLQVNERGELYAPGGIPYNPASPDFGGAYVLTKRDGMTFRIDGNSGKLLNARTAAGEEITFADDGIRHDASATAVVIDRDSSGRIIAIVDPQNGRIHYGYEGENLSTSENRVGAITSYNYDPTTGYLESVDGPGAEPLRLEYDDEGRVQSVVEQDGRSFEFSFDPSNRLEETTDPAGSVTISELDPFGNIVARTNPLGETVRWQYDSRHRLTNETDPLGNQTFYTYGSGAEPLRETDALGFSRSFTHDAFGQVLTATDSLGNTTANSYGEYGELVSQVNAEGFATEAVYDPSGLLIAYENSQGIASSITRDNRGNIVEFRNENGDRYSYTYDANGLVLSESKHYDTYDAVTTLSYDGEGRLERRVDALGNAEEFGYDLSGNLVRTVDKLGRETLYRYDGFGRNTEVIYPDSTPDREDDNPREIFQYDTLGNLVSTTDADGNRTLFRYDVLSRLVETVYPDATESLGDNPRVTQAYDALGRVISRIDENGNETEFIYDALRIVTRRDALGGETHYRYDGEGNLVEETNPLGRVQTYAYDKSGVRNASLSSGGANRSTELSANSETSTAIDAKGSRTVYERSGPNRLLAVTNRLGSITQYEYGRFDELISTTNGNGHTTGFEYDQLGRLVKQTLPMGQTSSTAYDSEGNVVSSLDFNGDETTFEYDSRNQIQRVAYADSTFVEFAYSASGLLTSTIDPRGETTYEYDARSRLVKETAPDGHILQYEYDGVGNVVSFTNLAGTTTYEYDALSRLVRVTSPSSEQTEYVYDAAGQLLTKHLPNSLNESYAYNTSGRLASITVSGVSGVLDSISYLYDANGNRTEVVRGGERVTYEYDREEQLVGETIVDENGSLESVVYENDLAGNRIAKHVSGLGSTIYIYDNNGRLVEITGVEQVEYEYDDNGNRILERSSGQEKRYLWGKNGRLIGYDSDGDGIADVTFEYDAEGNLVRRVSSGEAVNFQVASSGDLSQIVAEYDDAGVLSRSYVYGLDRLSVVAEGSTYFYHHDAIESVVAISDSSAAIDTSYEYDAFGNATAFGDFANPFRFTGEYFDDALGLTYLRARYMDPATGSFVSRDPFSGILDSPISQNKFTYAHNNPVNLTDASGNSVFAYVFGGLSVVALFAAGGYVLAELSDPEPYLNTREDEIRRFNYTLGGAGVGVIIATGGIILIEIGAFSAPVVLSEGTLATLETQLALTKFQAAISSNPVLGWIIGAF